MLEKELKGLIRSFAVCRILSPFAALAIWLFLFATIQKETSRLNSIPCKHAVLCAASHSYDWSLGKIGGGPKFAKTSGSLERAERHSNRKCFVCVFPALASVEGLESNLMPVMCGKFMLFVLMEKVSGAVPFGLFILILSALLLLYSPYLSLARSPPAIDSSAEPLSLRVGHTAGFVSLCLGLAWLLAVLLIQCY